VALFLAVIGGILLAPGGGVAGDPSQPLVDVATEDQAIAALQVYEAESVAIEEVMARADIYASPGPDDVRRAVGRHLESVRAALGGARDLPAPGTLAESWWLDRDHDRLVAELAGLQTRGRLIASLTAIHDSLYGGAGEVSLAEAEAFLAAIPAPPQDSLARWADLLRDALDGAGDAVSAQQARDAVGAEWAARLSTLRPVPTEDLRAYLGQLAPRVLQGLSGHPLAGPGLRRLRADG